MPDRLDRLTRRWRERHEARREAAIGADALPLADPIREARAGAAFPWRSESPAAYAERHAEAMPGFTYDAYRYQDAALETWLHELGRLLRERRAEQAAEEPAAEEPMAEEPMAEEPAAEEPVADETQA